MLWTLGTDNSLSRMTTYIAESQSGLFEFNSLAELETKKPSRYSRTLPLRRSRPTTRQSVAELARVCAGGLASKPALERDGRRSLGRHGVPHRAGAKPARRTGARRADRSQTVRLDEIPAARTAGVGRHRSQAATSCVSARAASPRRRPTTFSTTNCLNDGFRIADITLTGTAIPVPDYAAYRNDAATNPGLPAGAPAPAPYVNLVDPGFKTPSVWKASASYRRRLGERLALTGTLLYSRTTDDYMYVDRNLRPRRRSRWPMRKSRGVRPGHDDRRARTHAERERACFAALGRVLELTNTGEGRQHAEISRRGRAAVRRHAQCVVHAQPVARQHDVRLLPWRGRRRRLPRSRAIRAISPTRGDRRIPISDTRSWSRARCPWLGASALAGATSERTARPFSAT